MTLITDLENNEADPDQLQNLFKLDHLATRMRRNGENLLVLAGEDSGRSWNQPVPLVDVMRAGCSKGAAEQYVLQIEQHLSSAALMPLGAEGLEQRRVEFLKLLRMVPDVTDIAQIDAKGREQVFESRLGLSTLGSNEDRLRLPAFRNARAGRTWFSPVYFRKETEPYMTISRPAGGRDARGIPRAVRAAPARSLRVGYRHGLGGRLGDVEPEWRMAALVLGHKPAIHPDLRSIVHSAKMEQHCLRTLTGLEGDRAAIPDHRMEGRVSDTAGTRLGWKWHLDGAGEHLGPPLRPEHVPRQERQEQREQHEHVDPAQQFAPARPGAARRHHRSCDPVRAGRRSARPHHLPEFRAVVAAGSRRRRSTASRIEAS